MKPTTNYLINILGENAAARAAIRNLDVFEGCSEQLVDLLYNYGKVGSLNAGEDLIHQGNFDQWIFIILRGSLSVFVNGGFIEHMSSSLVGERCILGESRGATLQADADGTSYFGIDMALIDALMGNGNDADLRVVIELFVIINRIVIDRVLGLWTRHVNAQNGLHSTIKATVFGKVIQQMRVENIPLDPEMSQQILALLRKHFGERTQRMIDALVDPKSKQMSTVQLSHALVRLGRFDLLCQVAKILQNSELYCEESQQHLSELRPILSFREIIDQLASIFADRVEDEAQFINDWVKKYLLHTKTGHVFLQQSFVDDLLEGQFKMKPEAIIEVLTELLQKALELNATVNAGIQQYQSKTQDVLTASSTGKDTMVSKNTTDLSEVEQDLITPYMAELKRRSEQSKNESKLGLSQSDIDDFFLIS